MSQPQVSEADGRRGAPRSLAKRHAVLPLGLLVIAMMACVDKSPKVATTGAASAPTASSPAIGIVQPQSAVQVLCGATTERLRRTLGGFAIQVMPSSPAAGEQVHISATGLAPALYHLELGIPQSDAELLSPIRVTVDQSGTFSTDLRLPRGNRNEVCYVISLFSEAGIVAAASPLVVDRDANSGR